MSTAFITLVMLIVFTIVFLIISLAKLLYYGKQLGQRLPNEERGELLALHTKFVNDFLLALITAVILVELLVIEREGRLGDPLLFKFHFLLDIILVIVLVIMRYVVTGVKDRAQHKRLARYFYILFALVFATGGVLMMQVLMKH